MTKQILKNVLLFIAIFMALNLIFRAFGPNEDRLKKLEQGTVSLITTESEYPTGKTVAVTIKNNTQEIFTLPLECPKEPLKVFKKDPAADGWNLVSAEYADLNCKNMAELSVAPEKELTISYEPWNNALFHETGEYKISLTYHEKEFFTEPFSIVPQGIFRFSWYHGLFRPIYNVLIFFAKILPFHSLGFSIILLTILIRLILFIPSGHAMRSQKKMQELQPLLEKIKKKYEGNQQKISEETMKVWKEHKVNPFGGCLPLVIQLPILIALFYVIQAGIQPDDQFLLYGGLKNFPLSVININFLNILDLTQMNRFGLPLIVGLLQFVQMKMAVKPKKPAGSGEQEMQQTLHITQNMMTYAMPVMIAVFAATVPSGVGLYWGISTVFGIAQQWLVNRERKRVE